jgi:hypothetical protein
VGAGTDVGTAVAAIAGAVASGAPAGAFEQAMTPEIIAATHTIEAIASADRRITPYGSIGHQPSGSER